MHEPTKALAALKKQKVSVKNTISWRGTDNKVIIISQSIIKLKTIMKDQRMKEELNEFKRAQGEDINIWQTRCRDCRQ